MKLFDSELKVMEVLWQEGPVTAKRIVDVLNESIGWNKNTTYTVIKKCIAKDAIQRSEPNFLCTPLVTKEAIQQEETDELIDRIYDGSVEDLFASLIDHKRLNAQQIDHLRKLVEDLKEQP